MTLVVGLPWSMTAAERAGMEKMLPELGGSITKGVEFVNAAKPK